MSGRSANGRTAAAARWVAIALCVWIASACATGGGHPEGAAGSNPAPASRIPGDPIERVNRPIFGFNDGLDRLLFEPVATGWTWITPQVVRQRLDKAFHNLDFPARGVNSLLQGDVRQSGVELGRFLANTTVGIVGLFDPAGRLGLESRDEDFDQTLGAWGSPPGAYLMLPILGPSSVRGLAALPLDLVLHPSRWIPYASTVNTVNSRALALDTVREAREASLDFYAAVRDAYRQSREAAVRNGEVIEDGPSDDLYELEDEE